MLPASTEVDELEFSWVQEFGADWIGIRTAISAMSQHYGVDLALSYWGAELFFSSLDVMDRAVSYLRHGDESYRQIGTHPPNKMRREFLRTAIKHDVGEESAIGPIQLGQAVEFIMNTLWERTRPALVALRDRGIGAAELWATNEVQT